MLSNAQLIDSPVEKATDILAKAFNPNGRRRREAMRILNQVLRLAKKRGFKQADLFIDYFKRDPNEQSPQILQRILFNLFEFVSPEEFALMSQGF